MKALKRIRDRINNDLALKLILIVCGLCLGYCNRDSFPLGFFIGIISLISFFAELAS